jgi:hypothetical protein
MVVARAAVWSLTPLLMLGALVVQLVDPTAGPVTVTTVMTAAAYLVALLAPYVVGLVLTVRVPSHGAGWSFLGLATVLAWSSFVDEYAAAALSGELHLPGATLMATLSDSSFVGWFVFLTLCLHYTAAGANARLRRLPVVTLTAAGAYQSV